MSRAQKKGREGALCMLYALDQTDADPMESLERSRELLGDVDDAYLEHWEYLQVRVLGIDDHERRIDEAVQEVSSNWRIERMDIVDRNLLRIGAWELFESDIPPVVSIDACVELAKRYGTDTTPDFVNGLLDQICQDHGIEVA